MTIGGLSGSNHPDDAGGGGTPAGGASGSSLVGTGQEGSATGGASGSGDHPLGGASGSSGMSGSGGGGSPTGGASGSTDAADPPARNDKSDLLIDESNESRSDAHTQQSEDDAEH